MLNAIRSIVNELLTSSFVAALIVLAILSELRSRRRRNATDALGRSLYVRTRPGESRADYLKRVLLAAELAKNVGRHS